MLVWTHLVFSEGDFSLKSSDCCRKTLCSYASEMSVFVWICIILSILHPLPPQPQSIYIACGGHCSRRRVCTPRKSFFSVLLWQFTVILWFPYVQTCLKFCYFADALITQSRQTCVVFFVFLFVSKVKHIMEDVLKKHLIRSSCVLWQEMWEQWSKKGYEGNEEEHSTIFISRRRWPNALQNTWMDVSI